MTSLELIGGAVSLLLAILFLVFKFTSKSSSTGPTSTTTSTSKKKTNNKPINRKVALNPEADAKYILNTLSPSSTPLDILYTIATSPDNIAVATKSLELRDDVVQRKMEHLAEQAKKVANATLDDLLNDEDDDAWADDDEDDEAAMAAKKAKAEKEKEAAALAKATGKDAQDVTKVMLEGVDDDVLGMQWVKRNLTKLGAWPPPHYQGSMEEPSTERNLIMTMGRLNARALNTHPELLEASPKGQVDPTYFQSTLEFRQRVLQQLENVLRMACTLRSFKLVCAVLDATLMFKVGLMEADSEADKMWFKELMNKTYGDEGMPKLSIEEPYLGVPTEEPETKDGNVDEADKKEEEKNKLAQMIAQTRQVTTADEKMSLEMTITRPHAEPFTKQKIAQCQRQGIPPQLGLQAYREVWFIIVRAYKLNEDGSRITNWDGAMGGADPNPFVVMKKSDNPLMNLLSEDTISSFETEFKSEGISEKKVVVGWPFVISNVAQKTGKIKIQLPPPDEPGRYEFCVTIKSQEFLCEVEDVKVVVDVAKGVKKEEKDVVVEEESKKEK